MSNAWFIDIPGASGKSYRYYEVDAPRNTAALDPVSANYAFLKKLANGNFEILYCGEAENARDRLPNHERWPDAIRAGMTMVVGHATPGGVQARKAEERDLIVKWNPVLNVQHRTTG